MKVLVLSTGGTIDAAAYPENSEPPVHSTATDDHRAAKALENIAHHSGLDIELHYNEICNKDSKFISEHDRMILERTVLTKGSNYQRIIVTIGTDCMTDVAQDLAQRLHNQVDCPVVFTGAIWPLANADRSDGIANLRLALLSEPQAKPNIYIAMHDLFLPCTKIRKNFEEKKFYKV